MSLTPDNIRQRHAVLLEEQPHIRARDAACALGISEGELLASNVGQNVLRLNDDIQGILEALRPLGTMMGLTRNESCVHERHGVYDKTQFFQQGKTRMGLFINPDIDLRLFLDHWKFHFAATEQTRSGRRKSLQFFTCDGLAIHKIYLPADADETDFDAVVEKYRHPQQEPTIATSPYPASPPDRPDEAIDWKGLRKTWENLKDTHDFFMMLKKFEVGRLQALRNIGTAFCRPVANDAVRRILTFARDRECPIMVFVGNRGCLQIHTGFVHKLAERGSWYNVLDPTFNLHLREDHIGDCWVTKKPTLDGIVSALEVFDTHGELIVTFFGKRKPGIPELSLWRSILADVPDQNLAPDKNLAHA